MFTTGGLTACVPPSYLTGTLCSVTCPPGQFGNFTTATCEDCKFNLSVYICGIPLVTDICNTSLSLCVLHVVPSGFAVFNNATVYPVSFRCDIELNTIILNYTILVNRAVVGNIFGIFVSFYGGPIIQN